MVGVSLAPPRGPSGSPWRLFSSDGTPESNGFGHLKPRDVQPKENASFLIMFNIIQGPGPLCRICPFLLRCSRFLKVNLKVFQHGLQKNHSRMYVWSAAKKVRILKRIIRYRRWEHVLREDTLGYQPSPCLSRSQTNAGGTPADSGRRSPVIRKTSDHVAFPPPPPTSQNI